uniref:AAA_12 domain-containing protein n=1 Tax=Steinernema glaseri TaxID=37863 RepID=A0A1I7ZVP7_9BILA
MGDSELQLAFNALSVSGVIAGPSYRGGRGAALGGLRNPVPIDPSLGHPYGECNATERPGPSASVSATGRKLLHDGFDDLREKLDLKQYMRARFEQKVHPEDEREKGSGLEQLVRNPGHLVEAARHLCTVEFEEAAVKRQPKKPVTERNYREDKPDCVYVNSLTRRTVSPVLYRIIEQIDNHTLLCEVVFASKSLSDEMLHFIVLDKRSNEAPAFEHSGFNVQFVDINDLVWIYDIYPYEGAHIADVEDYFLRATYKENPNIFWASRAHCFLKTAEFQTAYGYVITDRGDSIITGSDEVVDISKTELVQFLGGNPSVNDMFRIDYVCETNYQFMRDIAGTTQFHAGFPVVLKPARRDEKVYVIAASVLSRDTEKMMNPFSSCDSILESIELQTRAYTLGKFTDAVMQQIDADAVIIPATIQWQNDKCGKLIIKGGDANYSAFRGSKLATIVVPNLITLLVKLETYKRSARKNHCLNFTTFPADRLLLLPIMKDVKRIVDVNVSPIEMNPSDDVLLKYLYTGTMRRQLKAHLLDKGQMNSEIFNAMRYKRVNDILVFDESSVKRIPFVYNKQSLVLDKEQSIALDFVTKCDPHPSAVVVQACAGAGKTLCSVALMVETMRMDSRCVQFMCAPTNRAVDNMAYALSNCEEARPIRLFSKSALDKFEDNEPKYSLNSVMKLVADNYETYGLTDTERSIVKDYMKLCQKLNSDSNDIAQMGDGRYHTLTQLRQRAEGAVYNILVARYKPNVILTTVDMGLRDMLSTQRSSICKQRFYRILIDEASQLDEPKLNAIFSLNMNTRQVVLVGDPKQLPPYMVQNIPEVLRDMSGKSALDAMMGIRLLPVVELHIGYRMHCALLALTSEAFYDCSLVAAKTGPWMSKERLWKRMDNSCPIIVGYVGGNESSSGTSKYNDKEAKIANALVREAIKDGVAEADIGVICLYNAQVRTVCKLLANTEVEVSSVDSFQGREKDYIIVLTTRSTRSDYYKSFFADVRRANVATSRAILGMVILGEEMPMRSSLPWVKVTDFAQRYNLIKYDLEAQLQIST